MEVAVATVTYLSPRGSEGVGAPRAVPVAHRSTPRSPQAEADGVFRSWERERAEGVAPLRGLAVATVLSLIPAGAIVFGILHLLGG